MSKEAVLQFCSQIAENKELQEQIRADVQQGKTLDDFTALAGQSGHEFTSQDAGEVFEEERAHRSEMESGDHAETVIVKDRSSEFDDDQFGMTGFRRVALSMNWQLGSDGHSGGESIHE